VADEPAQDCGTVITIARNHLEEVERKLADLRLLRRQLRDLLGRCAGGSVADCRIIGALAPSCTDLPAGSKVSRMKH
jgi:hypothetical protein